MKNTCIFIATAICVLMVGLMAQADDVSIISVGEMAAIKGFCGSGRCNTPVRCGDGTVVGYECNTYEFLYDECDNPIIRYHYCACDAKWIQVADCTN